MSDIKKKIANQLYEKFVVNNSVIGIQREDGNYIAVKTLFSEQVIEKMLETSSSLGTYQQQTYSDMLRWVCFDFDCKNKESLEDALYLQNCYVKPFLGKLESLKIDYALEFSGRRGFHVWILFDRLITKDLGYAIVQCLAGDIYREIANGTRFGLDLFPKTSSGHVKNKYGLMVKIPLSKHKKGTYSHFIQDMENFEFGELVSLSEDFLRIQNEYLENCRRNSVDNLINKLNIIYREEKGDVIYYKKDLLKYNGNIEFKELESVFSKDVALKIIWNNIVNGRMSLIDKKVMLGTFAQIPGGDVLLWEMFRQQSDFNAEITNDQIKKNRRRFFPLTMTYLHELYAVSGQPTDESVLEFIMRELGIDYEILKAEIEAKECDIKDIVEKEKNYYLYNDEVIDVEILKELNAFSQYDFMECEKYISSVIEGKIRIPLNIDYKVYERKEESKTRKMVSLYPKERVITTALTYELLQRLQRDYKSFSYHLNTTSGGDVFYPWISSWKRFNQEIMKYFQLPIFEEMSFIKADLKSCYDNVYLQVLRKMFKKQISESRDIENICNYLISFNERIMLYINGHSQGVPQGPAYARVLAEYVLDSVLRDFFRNNSKYNGTVSIYRYVDDMYIFYDSSLDGKELLKELAQTFESNKLFFNKEKTKVYGKISEMPYGQLKEFKEMGNMVYDIQRADDFAVIDTEFDEVYSAYIFRKKDWDINDTNFILSSSISVSLKKRYINEYLMRIVKSEIGRGSVFSKFYKFILDNEEYMTIFFQKKCYLEIPINTINFKNFIYHLFNMNSVIKVYDDLNGLLLQAVQDLLKKDGIDEEQMLLLTVLKDELEGV